MLLAVAYGGPAVSALSLLAWLHSWISTLNWVPQSSTATLALVLIAVGVATGLLSAAFAARLAIREERQRLPAGIALALNVGFGFFVGALLGWVYCSG